MTDVFISYSRKDIAFARLLHEALVENQLETWIDWQDIPPSADWLAEVYEAIEGADAFVFIISETSLASEICGLEIAHAAKHNKRLIPIVIKDVEAEQVPKELSVLNWIFFDEAGEKFAEAMDDLVTAITVDQDWVKGHTRFQNRALDWEKKGRDRGALLRGADLSEAEAWLSGSAEKDPGPTALQTEFILKSREDATRRQRMTLMGVGAALVVAIGLGVLAWTQRNVAVSEGNARATAQYEAIAESELRATAQAEAEEQSRIAIEQSDLATSRFLSSESLAKVDDQLDVSLLLAVQAARISPTTAARGSLLAALSARPNLETILTKQDSVYIHALGLSRDGNTLAASYYRRIEIWDLETNSLITELATPGDLDEYWGLTFVNGNEKVLGCIADQVDGDSQITCRLWDVSTGEDLGTPIVGIQGSLLFVTSSLAVSWDGSLAAIADENDSVYIYSLDDGKRLFGPLAGHESWIINAEFNPQGTILATGDRDGKIVLWDVNTGEMIGNRIRVLTEEDETSAIGVTGLAFSPDGELILAAGNDKSVLFYIDTIKLKKRLTGYESDKILAHFTPEGEPIVFVERDNYYVLWDAETGEIIGGRPDTSFLTGEMEDEILDPVHMRLITASKLTSVMGANILIWDLRHRLPFERHLVEDIPFDAVAYHPDPESSLLAAGGDCEAGIDAEESNCSGGVVYFWNTETGEQQGEPWVGHSEGIEDIVFNPDGSILATGSLDGGIILWDTETGDGIGSPLRGNNNWISDLNFSPDGNWLAAATRADEVAVRLWDLTQKPPVSKPLGAGYENLDSYDDLAFSRDGKTLAVCGTGEAGGRTTLWDLTELSMISHLDSDRKNRASEVVIFGPDGNSLLTAGIAGVRIWDYHDQEVLAEPPSESLDPPRIQSIALSPDGELLAAEQLHRELSFWDGTTGQLIAPPIKLPGEYESLLFKNNRIAMSPDGQQLAVVGNFGVLLWDLNLENWIEAACKMANRDLTPMEWRTYLGDRPYEETCPEDR